MTEAVDMQQMVLEVDREMCAKSFHYFFTDVLGFHYSHHHNEWVESLQQNRYYVVKASRDHGKSTLFMSYAL